MYPYSRDVSQEDWGGVWVTYNQRYTGVFTCTLRLYDFPFDVQDMVLAIESGLYTSDLLQWSVPLNSNTTLLPQSDFEVLEWNVLQPNSSVTVIPNYYYSQFQQYYSRILIKVPLRQSFYYVNKIVVGVVLLVLMTIFTFALCVEETDRMMGSFASFGSLVAYLFVTGESVPKIAYTTRFDEFMTLSFMVVFFISIYHGFVYILREKEHERSAARMAEEKTPHEGAAQSTKHHGDVDSDAPAKQQHHHHHRVDAAHSERASSRSSDATQNHLRSSSRRSLTAGVDKPEVEMATVSGRVSDVQPVIPNDGGDAVVTPSPFHSQQFRSEPDDASKCECCPIHFPRPKHRVREERSFARRFKPFSHLVLTRRFDIVLSLLFATAYLVAVLAIMLRPNTYDPSKNQSGFL
eukprot:gnl/Spiro4/25782_TR12827_c0_g1_i1.p1 gnl/Spiro4/25782_TR12827_c0_g1~~gnl/Spiro4/25782_TR12827_c0_g1_i1.p1  ORF type:complete len:406 (+),score=60.07 gnl/Spiro4/25782_TR12827_c0_g1_i1:497-1714(+)